MSTGSVLNPFTGDLQLITLTLSLTSEVTGTVQAANFNLSGLSKNTVYVDTVNYTTVQAAVTYAETLTAANSAPGVCVQVPAGQFAEDVVIKKNVSLCGAGITATQIKSVTIRPTSLTVGPDNICITGLTIYDTPSLVVSNETASGSGIFNITTMFTNNAYGLNLNNMAVATATISNLGYLNCRSVISTFTNFILTNIGIAELSNGCFIPDLTVNGDSGATGAPGGPTSVYVDVCAIYGTITTARVSGSDNPTLNFYNCECGSITVGANTSVSVIGGTVSSASGTFATYNPSLLNIFSAKGSLLSATAASTPAELAVGTNAYALIADSTQSTGLKWAQLSLTAGVTGVLPVANGGTNSSTSLNNNRIITSQSGALKEATAITASKALVSDANGIPVAATPSTTEINYVAGVTSAIQTQLDSKTTTSGSAGGFDNLGLALSVGSSALTIALKQADGSTNPSTGTAAVKMGFRSTTITAGSYTYVSATAATSVVVPSGATLGLSSGSNVYIYVYAINAAGTVELAVSTLYRDEQSVGTTTAIDTASDASGFYSTTARSGVAIRLIGRLKYATAPNGTYSAIPDESSIVTNPASAKILGYVEAVLSADTSTATADTYVDVTGASVTLQPGTWNITFEGSISGSDVSVNQAGNIRIVDGTPTLQANTIRFFNFNLIAGQTMVQSFSMKARQIVVTTTTAYKVQIRSTTSSTTGTITIAGAANQTGALTDPDSKCIMFAEQVA